MKTVFIINPGAGKGNKIDTLIEKIKRMSIDKEIYITKAVSDATVYVRNYCKMYGPARFIACGGDGTFNEVLNGMIGFDEAEIGIIPIGTGNDFYRNFENNDLYYTDDCYKYGKKVKCDAIKYTTETEKGILTGYCANMFNIGFDCNVADLTARMKKKPFISGTMAYLISVLFMLVTKRGANLKINIDGKTRHTGKLLLTSIANGCYCGGGVKSNPLASVCDGKININIVKNVSRLKFLYLFPYYMKGSYLKLKGIDKIISSEKGNLISVVPIDGNMRLCIDGEITDAGKTEFEICPSTFNYFIPCLTEKVIQLK